MPMTSAAEGPYKDRRGRVHVRVALDGAERRLLRLAAESEMRHSRLGATFDMVVSAALPMPGEDGPLDVPAETFDQLASLVSLARFRRTVGLSDFADLQGVAEAFDRAGSRTAKPCGRRRSSGMPFPKPVGFETAKEPSPEELADCGWRDLAQLRQRYPDDRLEVWDEADRNALEAIHLQGQCGPLAVAVHDETGWDIVAVRMPWDDVPSHLACRRPDGAYVDARGDDLTAAELVAGYHRWEGIFPDVAESSRDEALLTFRRHPFVHAQARRHMDVLLPDIAAVAARRP